MRLKLILIALAFVASTATAAKDAPSEFDVCTAGIGPENREKELDCEGERFIAIDNELVAALAAFKATLAARGDATAAIVTFDEEQRLWTAYQEAACGYLRDGFGTFGKQVLAPACYRNIAKDRAKHLRDLTGQIE